MHWLFLSCHCQLHSPGWAVPPMRTLWKRQAGCGAGSCRTLPTSPDCFLCPAAVARFVRRALGSSRSHANYETHSPPRSPRVAAGASLCTSSPAAAVAGDRLSPVSWLGLCSDCMWKLLWPYFLRPNLGNMTQTGRPHIRVHRT